MFIEGKIVHPFKIPVKGRGETNDVLAKVEWPFAFRKGLKNTIESVSR